MLDRDGRIPGSTRDRNRLAWIDVLRGVAIMAVIMHHAQLQITYGREANLGVIAVIDDAVTPFRMPILMLLSGLLLPISLEKSTDAYVSGKLRKIAWPYLVWSVIHLGVLAAASPFRDDSVHISDFAKIFYSPPTYHWYLAYLVIFYLLALAFKRQSWLLIASIPSALVMVAFVDGDLARFLYLWAFFLAGGIVSSNWPRLETVIARPVMIGIFIIFAVPVFFFAALGEDLRYVPAAAIGVFASVFALRPLMMCISNTSLGALLSSVGRQSIVYYVCHYLVVIVAFHIFARMGLSNPYALFFLMVVAALAASYVLVLLRRTMVGSWLFEWKPRGGRRKSIRRGAV